MIEYTVINGKISVKSIDLMTLGTASNLAIGDIERVHLLDAFESPPENVIVGVTIPLVPPQDANEEERGDEFDEQSFLSRPDR